MNSQDVMAAMRRVREPELEQDLVTLDMVRDVEVAGDSVSMKVALVTPGSPFQAQIEDGIRKELAGAGVRQVRIWWQAEIPQARGTDKPPLPGIKNLIAVGSGKGGVARPRWR